MPWPCCPSLKQITGYFLCLGSKIVVKRLKLQSLFSFSLQNHVTVETSTQKPASQGKMMKAKFHVLPTDSKGCAKNQAGK